MFSALRGSLPTPTVEDFAVLLGFSNAISPFVKKIPPTEIQKFENMYDCVSRLHECPETQQHIILAEFYAKYLPATVDRFVNDAIPELDRVVIPDTSPYALPPSYYKCFDSFFYMICAVQHESYFAKYIVSRKPVAASRKKVAQNACAAHNRNCDDFLMQADFRNSRAGPLFLAFSALRTVLVLLVKEGHGLSRQTQDKLLRLLHRWGFQHYDDDLGRITHNIISTLTNAPLRGPFADPHECLDSQDVREMLLMKKMLLQERKVCGWPACDASENLKACARCQTVCYVSFMILRRILIFESFISSDVQVLSTALPS
ncbi:hypothetical protein BDN72DRAFT_331973 [Pluteus cervinus]|uniref:Uncharacterized protein n=1 Tax=Pluteus cervinus TaxID=181527 RepID=A0ACD3AD47_9AGAR|nr:hypothetical protein BDN72DRAFT_331973 [Pluteus cervinus]